MRLACADNGIIAGIHSGSGALARRYIDDGFGMVGIGTDAAVIRAAYAAELAVTRGAVSAHGAARDPDDER